MQLADGHTTANHFIGNFLWHLWSLVFNICCCHLNGPIPCQPFCFYSDPSGLETFTCMHKTSAKLAKKIWSAGFKITWFTVFPRNCVTLFRAITDWGRYHGVYSSGAALYWVIQIQFFLFKSVVVNTIMGNENCCFNYVIFGDFSCSVGGNWNLQNKSTLSGTFILYTFIWGTLSCILARK
jgi:hypothetical protein